MQCKYIYACKPAVICDRILENLPSTHKTHNTDNSLDPKHIFGLAT